MSRGPLTGLVLLAVFSLANALLSAAVVIYWRAMPHRRATWGADGLLALRLLPSVGSLVIVFGVVLPGFLAYEPIGMAEVVGPALWILALLSVVPLADGLQRTCRAAKATRALLDYCGSARDRSAHQDIEIVEVMDPIVAVVGSIHPRMVASRRAVSECTDIEFRQIVNHERAHLERRDNLRLLAIIMSPDILAWTATGAEIARRWRLASEFEADERATGADRAKRVALAAALIKVARLAIGAERVRPTLSMPVALDDIDGRVRALLSGPQSAPSHKAVGWAPAVVALAAVAIVAAMHPVHRFVELLVALGG